jgi:hypothetical protein
MLEIVWDTTAFNDKNEWPADGMCPFITPTLTHADRFQGSQPFVLSTGDNTGYGQYVNFLYEMPVGIHLRNATWVAFRKAC